MKLLPAVPELPVRDVVAAQAHYTRHLGFQAAWHNEAGRIGAVAHGECALFLRESDVPITPVTLWFFAEEIDAMFYAFRTTGAQVAENIEDKPWGLRQFTLVDADGHRLIFHHDL